MNDRYWAGEGEAFRLVDYDATKYTLSAHCT